MMRPRYVMTVDTARCVGCSACALACKAENNVPAGNFRSWVTVETTGIFPQLAQQIRSERCNQCGEAPCVDACPTGASHYAKGGVVLVNAEKCAGCKACVAACSYGARSIHPDGYADKCTFCLHRLERGEKPACVEVCPAAALTLGDRTDPDSEVAKLLRTRQYRVLKPERHTEPSVFFLLS